MTTNTPKVELLDCKCKSCTHWEIGRDFILCKTCGTEIPAKIVVDEAHSHLSWKLHNR